jgi:hypothetical protein
VVVTIRFTSSWAVRALAATDVFLRFHRETPRLATARLWMRALAATCAGLVLCTITIADVPPRRPHLTTKPDPRAVRLENFFRSYRCPVPYHVAEYLLAADTYGLDYRLLPAVSLRETLCGVAEVDHNRWGYHPGRQSFNSIEAGIDFVARELAQGAYYKGKTLERKLFTYNPRPAYPQEIQRIMLQIE